MHRRLVEERAYRKLLAEARVELVDLLRAAAGSDAGPPVEPPFVGAASKHA